MLYLYFTNSKHHQQDGNVEKYTKVSNGSKAIKTKQLIPHVRREKFRVPNNHSVNNRTVVQLPLTASHPALGCCPFIACTNLPYAFWVTVHF